MVYLCIDLKSFYASVECVERNLDPFKTNLVVADPSRGNGSICLAITPRMKQLGIHNRCRVFEIPKGIDYMTAMPRMKLYMEYSANIYGIYLKYISKEDIHIYSIDECFIDLTPYVKFYNKSPSELVLMLKDAVFNETGITATCGIGTNMFLAKIALDISAKHEKNGIGELDEKTFKKTLWYHRPITDIWNIGKGTAKRLEKYGVFDLHGVTLLEEEILYKEFGINAEFLIDHAKGIEPCTMNDIHEYKSQSHSLSNGQILFEDYSFDNAMTVMREMVDNLVLELVDKDLTCNSVSLNVGYSKDIINSSSATRKLDKRTNSFNKILEKFNSIYREIVNKDYPIRRINISFNNVSEEKEDFLDLFGEVDKTENEYKVQKAVAGVKKEFGKNSILKAMSYKEKATAILRNSLVGGHKE